MFSASRPQGVVLGRVENVDDRADGVEIRRGTGPPKMSGPERIFEHCCIRSGPATNAPKHENAFESEPATKVLR